MWYLDVSGCFFVNTSTVACVTCSRISQESKKLRFTDFASGVRLIQSPLPVEEDHRAPEFTRARRIALLLLFAKEALITRFINSFLTQVRYFHHSRSIQLSPRRNRATSKSPPLAILFSRLPFPKHVADLEFCISNANLIYSGKRRYKKFQREEILNEHFFKIKLS